MSKISWYEPKLNLSIEQKNYLKMLEEKYNVYTPTRQVVPYKLVPWQKEFHSLSLNILMDEAPDILFEKTRGISFSTSSIIDLIETAQSFNEVVIPIISQREGTAKDLVKLASRIARDANFKIPIKVKETELVFQKTGSIIRAYPSSGAHDAVRSHRLIRALIDEAAFQRNLRDLIAAVADTMQTDIGQILMGSTHYGTQTRFYELCENPVTYYKFSIPVFNPAQFNPNKSILEQNLVPAAPWYSLKKLEKRRQEDLEIFLQEYMCKTLDDSQNYLPYQLIIECTPSKTNGRKELVNHLRSFNTSNPVYGGMDIASTHDWAVVTFFEKTEFGFVQRHLTYFKTGIKLPVLQNYVDNLLSNFSFDYFRVDSTGMGEQISQFLSSKYGSKVEPVHFASRIKSSRDVSVPVREKMAMNMKALMQEKKVAFINDINQIKQLNKIDYSLKVKKIKGVKSTDHADIFWADALALLPEGFKYRSTVPLEHAFITNKKEDKKTIFGQDQEKWIDKIRRLRIFKHRK